MTLIQHPIPIPSIITLGPDSKEFYDNLKKEHPAFVYSEPYLMVEFSIHTGPEQIDDASGRKIEDYRLDFAALCVLDEVMRFGHNETEEKFNITIVEAYPKVALFPIDISVHKLIEKIIEHEVISDKYKKSLNDIHSAITENLDSDKYQRILNNIDSTIAENLGDDFI